MIGTNGNIEWDFSANRVSLLSKEKTGHFDYSWPDNNQMYVDEMKHFIACVKGREKPLLGIADALSDLKVALAAKKSAQSGKVERV